jgi:trehalose/maltose hydrolase-like predicted phosphorylase
LISSHVDPARPSTVAAGIYDSDTNPALLPGPRWTAFTLHEGEEFGTDAQLDLHRGVLTSWNSGEAGTARTIEFASIVRPGVHVIRVDGPAEVIAHGRALHPPRLPAGETISEESGPPEMVTVTSTRGVIASAAEQRVTDVDGTRTVTRLVATAAVPQTATRDATRPDVEHSCRELLADAVVHGFDALLAEHQDAWRRLWDDIAIDIGGDAELQRAVRLAQFHLIASSDCGTETAIGARGMTGPAYRGHVFWDADVFVVPALSAMSPQRARAALRYRWNRLDAARERAAAEGRRGARFPWESGLTGDEVTPGEGIDLHGDVVAIRTGQQEEHIVADVAWAVVNHVLWTGDDAFMADMGAEILLETARYWQSRVDVDADGSGHIRHVIGPDEYHEDVDDNAFTNAMACWNLTTAAEVCERLGLGEPSEWSDWRDMGDRLVDGFDAASGVHEQFAGYFDLDPVLAASLGDPPIPASALLGHERIAQVQIIKQSDVAMMHHLIPDAVPLGSLVADLDYYLPRTAHGSSLSPPITSSLLARAGDLSEAVRWFEMSARFDLDNLSGTTAGGVHLATMGGLWQAFTQGFLGVRPTADGLLVDPRVPATWGLVTHRFRYRSVPVRLDVSSDTFELTCPVPIEIIGPDGDRRHERRLTAVRSGREWSVA